MSRINRDTFENRPTQREGLRFEADQLHGYRNQSKSPTKIHGLIRYPTTMMNQHIVGLSYKGPLLLY
jgi:hypothetical protein